MRSFTYLEVKESTTPITNWSKFAVHPFSNRLLWFLVNYFPLSPNMITGLAFLLGIFSAVFYLRGDMLGFYGGAALFYLSFALDTIDGGMARLTKTSSKVGAWFDEISDFLRSGLLGAAISVGTYRFSGEIKAIYLGFGVTILGLFFFHLAYSTKLQTGNKPQSLANQLQSRLKNRIQQWGFVPTPLGLADYEALYLIVFPVFGQPMLGFYTAIVLGGLSRIVVMLLVFRHLRRTDQECKE